MILYIYFFIFSDDNFLVSQNISLDLTNLVVLVLFYHLNTKCLQNVVLPTVITWYETFCLPNMCNGYYLNNKQFRTKYMEDRI